MNKQKLTMIAAVLSFGLFTFEESAPAQSNCQQAKGQHVEVFDGVTNTTTGTVTNGGWLNGTTLSAFSSGNLPTPDPTTITFTSDFTLTTNEGQLKSSHVYLFDFVASVGPVLGRINPTTSTGRFAGATGVLYFTGKVTSFSPFTVQSEITGEICFAK